jgi:ATP-dependent DNA helicase DinG
MSAGAIGAQGGARVIQGPWSQVSTGASLPSRTLDVFADVLPSAWPGYSARDGQSKLTRAIAETIERGGVMLADAPCGTGKSLAYLVPAILHADREGRAVIVVTASIALQEQLVTKDLPALAIALAPVLSAPLMFALLKGRGNYLCQNTVGAEPPTYLNSEERDELDAVDRWARTTETGDRGDLPLIVRDGVWRLRTVGTDDCLRDGCDYHNECHPRAAKARAEGARVIVVNYALLYAHVALHREMCADMVLPKTASAESKHAWDVVIFDEAHEAADKAREALGCDIGEGAFKGLARWVTKHAVADLDDARDALVDPPAAPDTSAWRALADDAEDRASALWVEMGSRVPPLRGHPGERVDHQERLAAPLSTAALRETVEGIAAAARIVEVTCAKAAKEAKAEGDDRRTQHHRKGQRRAGNVSRKALRLAQWLAAAGAPDESPQVVLWVERKAAQQRRAGGASGTSDHHIALRGAFVEVGDILRAELWQRTRATILTSATLTTGEGASGWEWMRGRMGLAGGADVSTLAVPSPFDFARQALLCLPAAPPLPDPTVARDAFDAAVCQVVERVARAAQGRTLGLFTSSRMARRAADHLRALGLPWPVLCQGEEPRPRLIERMRQGPSILCGTTSLWTGVDLPGEAVVAVVIDKIPFPAPGDPVRDAIAERAEKRTGDRWASFREESVPTASLAMRQGVGRLIRSVTDWGVVVVCDPRMASKGYGRGITRALGMPRQVRTLGEVEMWFRERASMHVNNCGEQRGAK